ncbi:MAG: manganese efflux pump [Opitutales bacterium]|nr:manganese efflux pump [Opitutales bacterium]
MDAPSAVSLGLALAVDASVVAFSCGLTSREHQWKCPLKLAAVTGTFQGLMPTVGFFAAGTFVSYISAWAHWLAFSVFLALGAMFIYNAWTELQDKARCGCTHCALRCWKSIFAIGVATSIDALAVGAGIACSKLSGNTTGPLSEKIFVPAAVIAGTTFFCVLAAFYATRIFRRLPVKLLGTAAGLVLIALGVRTLF